LIDEAKALKKELPAPLAVISGDLGVRRSGVSQGVEVILLHDRTKGQSDVGEFLFCGSFYKNIEISVDGEPFARVLKSVFPDEKKVTVETLKSEYNYAYVLSQLEETMKNKNEYRG
jgi:hypothetical protein